MLKVIKWFKRWGVNNLFELSGDAMKYVIIEDTLLEATRLKSQDAEMSNFEYYIANINLQYWPKYKAKMSKNIQSNLITPNSVNFRRALTLL